MNSKWSSRVLVVNSVYRVAAGWREHLWKRVRGVPFDHPIVAEVDTPGQYGSDL